MGKNLKLMDEIGKIENLAEANPVVIGVIIKSIDRTFSFFNFKGKFPKIVIDKCYDEKGEPKKYGSGYDNPKRKIIINMAVKINPLSCSSVVISYYASWAAAMHIFYRRNLYKRNPEERKKAAHRMADHISGSIAC